jgi:hypothetical protein
MAYEGHGWDCDCGCCAGEEEEVAKASAPSPCICPSCGKQIPDQPGKACSEIKCPQCGGAMQRGQWV